MSLKLIKINGVHILINIKSGKKKKEWPAKYFSFYSTSFLSFTSNVKLNTIKQESATSTPSPNSENSDPLKKMTRRLPPPPVRMVTRGVSGAVRPKSVDEILSSLDVGLF